MSVKTLYLKNVIVNGALSLQDGGTAPVAALTATGWTVARLAAPNFALMAVGSKPGTFSASDALAAFSAGSCWRSENPFLGQFAAGSWSLAFSMRASASASNQTGAVKCRIWKSAAPDGSSGLTEIGGGVLTGTTTKGLVTNATSASTVTWSPAAPVSFVNEYLFVQCEWSIVGASNNASADALFYIETAAAITTSDFAQLVLPGLYDDSAAAFAAYPPKLVGWSYALPALAATDDALGPPAALSVNPLTTAQLSDAESFPAAAVSPVLGPPFIASDELLYAPSQLNMNTVQPLMVDDSQSGVARTYPPEIGAWAFASPDMFSDAELLYTPVGVPGDVTLAPKTHPSDEDIEPLDLVSVVYTSGAYDEDVDDVPVAAALLWTQYAGPGLYSDHERVETCHGMGVTAQGWLLPFDAVSDDAEAIYGAVFVPGDVGIGPGAALDPDTVLGAQSEACAWIGAAKWTADGAEQAHAPAVEPGDVGIVFDVVGADDTVATAQLDPGAVPQQPDDVLSDDDTHHGLALVVGDATLLGFPHQELDDVLVALVETGDNGLGPMAVKDADLFRTAKISGGVQPTYQKLPPLRGSFNDPKYMIGALGKPPPPLTGSMGRVA